MQALRRIPEGEILAAIPLDSAKSYPTKMYQTHQEIRFAYADISNNEKIQLQIKLIPGGAKTSPHPQLVLFVQGDYHVERWLNYGGQSDPFNWTTWMELHLDAKVLNRLIEAVIKAEIRLEA